MVIIFKIWQIIIFSSKFSLNWAISSVFIFYFFSTRGGVVRSNLRADFMSSISYGHNFLNIADNNFVFKVLLN